MFTVCQQFLLFMYKSIKHYITSLLLCFAIFNVVTVSAQNNENNLQDKVAQNYKLYKVNIDKAFVQMNELLIEAATSRDTVSELVLLDRVCRYHYSKNDVNRLIDSAGKLRNKATLYKNSNFEAMSHVYMAEAYTTNLLTKKALKELDKAMGVLNNNPAPDVKTFYTRSNVLISQASLYSNMGKYEEAVKRIKKAVESYPGKKGSKSYNTFQHVNYSNLGDIYIKFNKDSAFYYATQSIKLLPAEQTDDWIMATNYYIIGKVYQLNKDNDSALRYLLMADKITKENGEVTNTADLYNSLIEIYSGHGDSLKVEEYKDKLKEHELFVLKSKYNSLQKVISEEKDEKPSNDVNLTLLVGGGLLLLTISIAVMIIYNRRKKLKIPSSKDHVITNNEYELLLEMIKKDDSSFIYTFEKLYPDFSKKLLAACPQLVQTEVEFCALLKMKLSTKQIAQLTYIETRTVQNKKHRIRKKLNLPAEVDIYHWFDTL